MYQQRTVKSVLNKSKRRDPWFLDDYTLNPYSACSFNCLYCYVRGSRYGTNMSEKLTVKTNAPILLDNQLRNRAKKNQYGMIVMSSATDPYLQIENEVRLTRQLLEIILKHRFPVHVITKSDLVLRDIDLLSQIREEAILPVDAHPGQQHRVLITFSFSTIRRDIAKVFEPGATNPQRRLDALRQFQELGFCTGASLMPLLPLITDTDEQLHEMYHALWKVKASYVMPASLTLFGNGPSDSLTLTLNAVHQHFPVLESQYRSFFNDHWQVPHTYRNALRERLDVLASRYGLPMQIPPKH